MPNVRKLRRAYFALLKELGIAEEDRHALNERLVGKPSTRKWTVRDWDRAIAQLQRWHGQHQDRHAHICEPRPHGVAEVAEGDMNAFGELVRRHQDSAWRIACHYVGDRAEAEDLAQEAFLKILDAASSYRPRARFSTYLYRVIANLCIDYHRKKRPDYFGEMPPQGSAVDAPDKQLSAAERDRAIQRALDQLPDRQRMAVVLCYFEDLPLAEIAEAMDTTYKAVERLLARARKSLAPHLEGFFGK